MIKLTWPHMKQILGLGENHGKTMGKPSDLRGCTIKFIERVYPESILKHIDPWHFHDSLNPRPRTLDAGVVSAWPQKCCDSRNGLFSWMMGSWIKKTNLKPLESDSEKGMFGTWNFLEGKKKNICVFFTICTPRNQSQVVAKINRTSGQSQRLNKFRQGHRVPLLHHGQLDFGLISLEHQVSSDDETTCLSGYLWYLTSGRNTEIIWNTNVNKFKSQASTDWRQSAIVFVMFTARSRSVGWMLTVDTTGKTRFSGLVDCWYMLIPLPNWPQPQEFGQMVNGITLS